MTSREFSAFLDATLEKLLSRVPPEVLTPDERCLLQAMRNYWWNSQGQAKSVLKEFYDAEPR